MFFPAFGSTRLSAEFIFQVEHLTTQLLASCDRSFLQTTIETDTLIQSLADELEFLGIYSRHNHDTLRESVTCYLAAHKPELNEAALKILNSNDQERVLNDFELPIRLPMMFGRRV